MHKYVYKKSLLLNQKTVYCFFVVTFSVYACVCVSEVSRNTDPNDGY